MILLPSVKNPEYEIELENGFYNLYPIKRRVLKDGTIKLTRDNKHARYGIHDAYVDGKYISGVVTCLHDIHKSKLEAMYYKVTYTAEGTKRKKIKETTLPEYIKVADRLWKSMLDEMLHQSLLPMNVLIN